MGSGYFSFGFAPGLCVRGRGLHKYACLSGLVPVRPAHYLEMAHRLSLIRTVQRHDTGAAVSPGAAGGSGESAAKGARRVGVQARTCDMLTVQSCCTGPFIVQRTAPF